MPLQLVRSTSNHALWNAFLDRVLPPLAHVGPMGHTAQVWLTHRIQRDLLLDAASRNGLKGWLNPPIQFFSRLPELFGIHGKPIGLLARRELISAIGYETGKHYGIQVGNADASITRGHMLDSFFGELLPEGVNVEVLRAALQRLPGDVPHASSHVAGEDAFAKRRNEWVVASFDAYLAALHARELYDARSIHALVADRIDAGALTEALAGATQLHVYGVYSARLRRRLLEALVRQGGIEVSLYTSASARDLAELATSIEDIDAVPSAAVRHAAETRAVSDAVRHAAATRAVGSTANVIVQPAPDANREMQWLARRVKALILDGVEPHEIAVVARMGLEDTRRALQALESAGVPATARVRTPLAEISALKAVLDLFRAAAQSWTYRPLRAVLASPYLGVRLDLRAFDRVAGDARPSSLAAWQEELERLLAAIEKESDPDARRMGIYADRLMVVLERFAKMRPVLERLDKPKVAADWLALTRELLADRGFRQRICRAPLDRQDVVRLDQRGVRQLERILGDWLALDEPSQELTPVEWYRSLRALLESQELVMTTPGQKGVQILEAHDAALLPFAATFIVHANDGHFPRIASPSGLFTEEERGSLATAGLAIDQRALALRRERALWDAVAAGKHVSVTYRTTDPRGTPLLPSLLVPPHDRNSELPRTDSTIDTPANAEQARRAAAINLASAIRAGALPRRIEVAEPAALRHALLNAYAETMRGAPERRIIAQPINAWNGQLRDPAVLDRLAARFSLDYSWSASQLESYATNPFFFLLERVLRLREIDEAEEDVSALTFGGVAHDVLESFYRDVCNDLPTELDDATQRKLVSAAERVFVDREAQREWLGAPILWHEQKQNILAVLQKYVEWELGHLDDKGESPVAFEHVLGGDDRFVPLTGYDVQGNAVQMRVAGRIDRIDRDRRGVHHVLDYKTGSIPMAKGYTDGATLQAPLYIEALRASGMPMGKGRYRALKRPGRPQNGAEVKVGEGKFSDALAIAFSIPARVRAGLFEATLAASAEWRSYHPDASVRRTNARVEGSRFNG